MSKKINPEQTEALAMLFNSEDYNLVGVAETYRQTIDRDQAIDDETGKAAYLEFYFYHAETFEESERFTAAEMEEYAKTW